MSSHPGSRCGLALYAAVIFGVLLSAFPAVEAQNFSRTLHNLSKAGRGVLIFESTDPERPVKISRASCEALTDIEGVQRSGVVAPLTTANFIQLGRDTEILQASATLLPELRGSRAIVGSALAKGRDVVALEAAGDRVFDAVAASEQPPGIDTNSAVVVAATTELVDAPACTAVLDPLAPSRALTPVLSAALRSEGSSISARRIFTEGSDPVDDFARRPGRFLPVMLGIVFGAGAAVVTRLRRSEIAVYLLMGSPPSTVAALITFEQLTVAGLAATSAAAGSLVLNTHYVSPLSQLMSCSAAAMVWAFTAIVLTVDLALRNPLSLAKDR